MRLVMCVISSASLTLVAASSAFADAPGATPALAEAPGATPAFSLMDNTGDGSKLEAEASVVKWNGQPGEFLVTRLLGQYISTTGFGGYGTVGMAGLVGGHEPDSGIDISNFEAGALYRYTSQRFDVGLRIGAVFSTGDDTSARLGLALARPADVVQIVSQYRWLRLGISPTIHQGPLFMRVDVGLDAPLDGPSTVPTPLHVNVGAGAGTRQWTATAELQKVFTTDSADGIDAAGLSVRYHGRVSPFLGVSTVFANALFRDVITLSLGVTMPL